MTELWTHQKKGITMLYEAIKSGFKRLIWCFPTGAGKSTVCARFVKSCVINKKKVLFAVHSKELVDQFADRLKDQFDVGSGIIMANVKENRRNAVQVASIMSLVRRDPPLADVVIFDECHRAKAATYQKIKANYPDAIFIGLTATPFRGDGKGLDDIFDTIVHPVTIKELIALGHLVGTKVFAPESSVDMTGVKMKMGDYDKHEMYDRFNDVTAYDSVVESYREHANNKKAIVFNINIEHSEHQNEAFLDAGIKSAHLDGETKTAERARIVQAFRDGEIDVLNNVGLFTEGFDVPDAECIIINRATKSFCLYVQIVGRGLRAAENKDHCVVLDHGGNTIRHGFVEDYDLFPFDLTGISKAQKKKAEEDKPTRECPACHAICSTREHTCKSCGYKFQRERVEMKMTEGEKLVMLDRNAIILKRIMNLKYNKAEKLPLHLLRIYQTLRGFKKGWAEHRAIEMKMTDVKLAADGSKVKDHSTFKRAQFLITTEEQRHGTDELLQELKKQLKGRKVDFDAARREELGKATERLHRARVW